ncbi:MAG TPA: hypothetical protein DD735_03900 [Clostridiales bacterium]|jgi:hypothetical protein|nr:hypothetical protein [Clostridiales bacterium]HBR08028.1 hypothetical protein [Clostridiales bacterium]
MDRSFDETRRRADDSLSDMECQRARLMRTYNTYLKHGAVNAAAELMARIEALENEIKFEEHMYRMSFY